MKIKYPLSICMLLLNCSFVLAQEEYADLRSANDICNFDDIHVSQLYGNGDVSDDLLVPVLYETNAYWIKLKVKRGGEFGFVVIPDQPNDDIDFILYEKGDGELNPLRKMTSGESFIHERSCLGMTGMLSSSLDHNESIGCHSTSDKFIKSIQLKDAKEYYLFFNNYNSVNGFTLSFEDSDIVLDQNCEEESELGIRIFPTITSDHVNIESDGEKPLNTTVSLINMNSKLVKTFQYNNDFTTLDVAYLDPGKYILRFESGKDFYQKTFIKI